MVVAVGLSGAVMTAYYLPLLAGLGELPFTWSLFSVTEALGVAGVLTWRTGRPEQRRWGLTTAIGALVVSVAAMVAAHILSGRSLIGVPLIMMYPVALWLSVHLLVESPARRPRPPNKPPRVGQPTRDAHESAAGPGELPEQRRKRLAADRQRARRERIKTGGAL